MYIIWLKRGYFISSNGVDSPPVDTSLKLKSSEFKKFIERVNKLLAFSSKDIVNLENKLDSISDELESWSILEWKEITEESLSTLFCIAYQIWYDAFKLTAGQDTDTHNETKNEKT